MASRTGIDKAEGVLMTGLSIGAHAALALVTTACHVEAIGSVEETFTGHLLGTS